MAGEIRGIQVPESGPGAPSTREWLEKRQKRLM